jgi:hypothetical protein
VKSTPEENVTPRPRFLWDYELSEAEVRAILSQPGLSPTKRWLIERILTEARFEEVFQYLDLPTIQKHFQALRLPLKVKQRWEYALKRWTS